MTAQDEAHTAILPSNAKAKLILSSSREVSGPADESVAPGLFSVPIEKKTAYPCFAAAYIWQ